MEDLAHAKRCRLPKEKTKNRKKKKICNFTHEPNSNPCLPNPYEPRSPHWLCISYNCFVNLDVSKFIKGSKLAPRQQQWWQRVRPKFSMALSPSLFGFFLPLLDWNFGVFIGFAGAFVVWVCWDFCSIFCFCDFVAGCSECLEFLLNFFDDGFIARTLYVCMI